MNVIKKVSGALLGLATLGLVIPAFAVQFTGGGGVERVNNVGSTSMLLGSAAEFCYLSRVKVQDTDGTGESADCRLIKNSSSWSLIASLGATGDAFVRCEALCYTTN